MPRGAPMPKPPVGRLTLLRPLRRDSAKAGQSARKTAAGPAIDYAELLQHFEKVQGKHLQGRHQRATRGGEPPERRGAAAF